MTEEERQALEREKLLLERDLLMQEISAQETQFGQADPLAGLNDAQRRIIGGANEAVQGVTFGLVDEAMAAGAAANRKVAGWFTGKDTKLADEYNKAKAVEERIRHDYEREHPVESTALNVGGSFVSSPLGVTKAVATKGVPFLKRAMQAMAIGTGEGAAIGAASADGGWDERLQGAGTGALVGSVLGGGTTAVGGLVNSMAKRRIAQNLVQPDGSQIPIPLVADVGENPTVDKVRKVVGESFGGAGALKAHQRPFLEAAERNVMSAQAQKEALEAQAAEILLAEQRTKLPNAQRTEQRIGQVKAQNQQAISDAEQWAQKETGRDAVRLRTMMQDAALPSDAPQELRIALRTMDPIEANTALQGWWVNNGFRMVKDNTFQWNNSLTNRMSDMAARDPSIALQFRNLAGKIEGMNARIQAAALKAGKGKDLSTDEFNKLFLDELKNQKEISGEALWAMRQEFAMPSNRASDAARSGTLRQVANEFDDEIRSQFGRDSDATKAFNEHISAWRPNITHRKATERVAVSQGGAYTPRQADKAGGTKDAGTGSKPLQDEMDKAVKAEKARKKALAGFKARSTVRTTERMTDKKWEEKQRALEQSLAAKNKADELKKTGDTVLTKAMEEAAKLKKRSVGNVSFGNQMWRTGLLGTLTGGGAIPAALGTMANVASLGAPILWGAAISRMAGSKLGQRVIAGQTAAQEAMARALRESERKRELAARALRRSTVQQAAQE